MTKNTIEQLSRFENAVASTNYSHCRARSWRASGVVKSDDDYIVTAYLREKNGVYSCGFVFGLDAAQKILLKHGKVSPLSPTEKN